MPWASGAQAWVRKLAVVGVAFWLSSSAFGVVIDTRITLQNSRQALTFIRGRKRPTDTIGGMTLQRIEDLVSTVRVNTVYSPMFQIELRTLDPVNYPPVFVPDGVVNFTLLPIEQTSLVTDPTDPNAVILTWSNIPIPNTTQLLQVVLRAGLRASDGKCVWQLSAAVTGTTTGQYYGVYAARFPYLAFKEIDDDGTDDNFLIPLTSGEVIPNPMITGNQLPERDPSEGSTQDAYFTYPGNIMSQFMAYYDDRVGIYMAAEDQGGHTKNLYFNKTNPVSNPRITRVYTYFTHFNSAPAPTSGETTNQIARELLTFNLATNLHYVCVSDVFNGDWLDATNRYRDWTISSSAPWIGRGPLGTRADIATNIVQTAYAFRWQLPEAPVDVDPSSEALKTQQAIAFYEHVRDLYDPVHQRDFVPLALLSQAQVASDGSIIGVGDGDDVAEPLRNGVPEFLSILHTPPASGFPVRAIALNRDTTGIVTTSPNVPEAMLHGVMRNADLSAVLGSTDHYRTCLASSWTMTRRTNILLQTLQDSFFNGSAGFTMAAVTGTGNFGFDCWAPMQDDGAIVDRGTHMHDVGGGNYLTAAWRQLAQNLKNGSQAIGVPFLLLGMEHTPETMIQDYILVGRSLSEPYDDTQAGVGRTVNGGYPVPLFKYLYHDFNPWPGSPPSHTSVVNTYVDATHPLSTNLLIRFRLAQLEMHGRLLMYKLSQNSDEVMYDGPPNTLTADLQDEHRYFAALATLRAFDNEHLVFGKALRDAVITPTSSGDSTPIRFKRLGIETTKSEPRILSSTWYSPSTTDTAIVFTNYTTTSASCSFTFVPSQYNLTPGTANYKVQKRVGITNWVDVPGWTFGGSDPSVTLGPVVVPGMEELNGPPWSVYRFAPLPILPGP
jgi:hypothetical protein